MFKTIQKYKQNELLFVLWCTGLHIVYTRDEVDVVQNLMFYIETAYKVAVSVLYNTDSLHILGLQ